MTSGVWGEGAPRKSKKASVLAGRSRGISCLEVRHDTGNIILPAVSILGKFYGIECLSLGACKNVLTILLDKRLMRPRLGAPLIWT